MATRKAHTPLDSLERFELIQIMFPDLLTDEHDLGDEEDVIVEQLGIDPEQFDDVVGRLVLLSPCLGSPLTGTVHHVLGRVTITDGQQHVMAAVKREATP